MLDRRRASTAASSASRRLAAGGGALAVSAAAIPGASRCSPGSDRRTTRDLRNAAARRSDDGSARNLSSATTSLTSSASKNPRPVVHVGRDAARLERLLELAVARARSEEDGDVRGPDGPADAALPVPHLRARRQPRNLGGDRIRASAHVGGGDDAERGVAGSIGSPGSSIGNASRSPYAEGVAPLAALRRDRARQVVDETQQARHRPEAVADAPQRAVPGAQRADFRRRVVEHADIGVPERVDRLLPVSDDEDRGRQGRFRREAQALAPGPHQQRHQFPLGARRVLELVDEHVVVARLEQVAAARELVHVAEQPPRADEQFAEVEHAPHLERAPVPGHADAEHLPHGAREDGVHVAPECANGVGDAGRRAGDERPVGLARGRAGVRLHRILVGRPLPRRAGLGEEVRAEPVDHALERRRVDGVRAVPLGGAHQPADVRREERVPGVAHGPAVEKRLQAAGDRPQLGRQPVRAATARLRHRQVARERAGCPPQHALGHAAPRQQRGEARPQPVLAELREQQRDALVSARPRAADAQRRVERLLDQARDLGLVGHVEARVEVGLERKLAKQGEAERVDGADGDVVEAVAQLAPADLVLG